ncbi:unnamed protein product [Peronospora destructor]|uniref:Thioredoxin reductase n=1 Tax=Peronospora destructor TaxID=86335 RepID=A0AAV0T1S7_9STRA|nr:unnamed protein product [Peronospora destructor]
MASGLNLAESVMMTLHSNVSTFHIAGWRTCPSYVKAGEVALAMQMLYPDRVAVEMHPFEDRDAFKQWLKTSQDDFITHFGTDSKAMKHMTSPFVWSSNPTIFLGSSEDLLTCFRSFVAVGNPQGVAVSEKTEKEPGVSIAFSDRTTIPFADATTLVDLETPLDVEDEVSYDYDLVVIGGGSGGLACSKEAASFGQKVCVLDYVKPSPPGHFLGFGWHLCQCWVYRNEADAPELSDRWTQLVSSVGSYIKSIDLKHMVELRSKYVKYENFLGSFVDPHTLELWHPKKGTKQITTRHVVIAVGGRPRELTCPGGEHAISSDDIFWMKKEPGKTLVVGSSTSQTKIGEYMEVQSGIEFIRKTVPQCITKLEKGQLLVKWLTEDGESSEEAFDTVLNATDRVPDVAKLGLDKARVKLNEKSDRIWVQNEQTSTPNIYAVGDVIDAPELTPVAIRAGRLLSRRLYNESTVQMDYDKVCTAVFTPIEYGCCGLSEENSKEMHGDDNVEVYHKSFTPLEWSFAEDTRSSAEFCYVKVVCNKTRDNLVLGFHYLGPNAGAVTQAMGLAMKLGFTYDQLVDTVGFHPTTAEAFTTPEIMKRSVGTTTGGGC